MTKRIITLLILFSTRVYLSQASAQSFSFDDLFAQQGKQKKLMTQQIGSLYLYLGAVKSGYQAMHRGLDLAGKFKGGTFGLNTAYYQTLKQVNQVVRKDPKGKLIAELFDEIDHTFDAEIAWQKKQQQFKAAELAYLEKVADNLRSQAGKDLDETTDVLTPGKLQLTDQQRLERLDKLYAAMKDKSAFAGSFTAKCRTLALSRLKAKAEREQIQKLYRIY
ncbi:hypothetical protein FPZ42_07245 [Mucilaginibacter achroorhodeus]|uniref:TerB family tellurite resistance protein n=1 Tax=Mucilaginibacter achroorhodeus TaxID=2599294 RepID=A0A563U666_9SPHI|nr:hypothetical protein [Mucilaginibacter achroorhodeus]TWR26825.1 hypothetical protein FPZ42_07245 [Mucilaginibacter achroorhodeus]